LPPFPPPSPAPPLDPVVVLPPVDVVAGVVVVVVVVEGGVVVVVVVVVGVVLLVVVVEDVVVDDVVVAGDFAQALVARLPTVDAHWFRLSVMFPWIEPGRFWIWESSCELALLMVAQLPDWAAVPTRSNAASSEFAWLLESRLEPPPQATRNAAAKPSPPIRMARGA
jgi:hypothetical protein